MRKTTSLNLLPAVQGLAPWARAVRYVSYFFLIGGLAVLRIAPPEPEAADGSAEDERSAEPSVSR